MFPIHVPCYFLMAWSDGEMAHVGDDSRSLAEECSHWPRLAILWQARLILPKGKMSRMLSSLCTIKVGDGIGTMNLCACTPKLGQLEIFCTVYELEELG